MLLLDVFPGMASVSAVTVIRAKNSVHSVLSFIPVSRNTSGLPPLLGPDFSAMIPSAVYTGAIAVSLSFVVMMPDTKIAEIHENVLRYLPVGGTIGLISWSEIFVIPDNDYIPILPTNLNTTYLRYTVYAERIQSWTNLETLGNLLYTNYPVPFPVSSPILLVAMIGAIVPTMHKTTKVKRQDVFQQNAIDFRRTIGKMRENKQIQSLAARGCCQSLIFSGLHHNFHGYRFSLRTNFHRYRGPIPECS